MQELEKILYELEKRIFTAEVYNDDFDGTTITNLICLGDVRDILEKHKNDGWISVEEEQPEEDGFYMATMDGEIVGQEEPFVGLAEFENGKWIDDEEDYKCVIAWRPLPEPCRLEQPETCKYTGGSCCWPIDQCGDCPNHPERSEK